MRTAIQQSLKELEELLLTMSGEVVRAVHRSIDALKAKDLEEAEAIRRDDEKINRMRWKIEEKAIKLMATQQPVATDLRELIALLNMITDLERMGDYAAGIAKIVLKSGNENHVKPLIDIPRMADLSVEMIERSITAWIERDVEEARQIHRDDDQVDELYHQVIRELVSIMIEDPSKITRCTHLIWIAHNLERIADRCTNICERIIFLVTGKMMEEI